MTPTEAVNGVDLDAAAQPDWVMRLSKKKYAALKESIARHGVRRPLEIDADGTLIDGHHRKKACDELGIKPPVVVRTFRDAEERYIYALTANLAGRRGLDFFAAWARTLQRIEEFTSDPFVRQRMISAVDKGRRRR